MTNALEEVKESIDEALQNATDEVEELSEEVTKEIADLEAQSSGIMTSLEDLKKIQTEKNKELSIGNRRAMIEANLISVIEAEKRTKKKLQLKEAENRLSQMVSSRTFEFLKKKRFAISIENTNKAIQNVKESAMLKININKKYFFKNPRQLDEYLKEILPVELCDDSCFFTYAFFKFISEKKNFDTSALFINNTVIGINHVLHDRDDEFSKELVSAIIETIKVLKEFHLETLSVPNE